MASSLAWAGRAIHHQVHFPSMSSVFPVRFVPYRRFDLILAALLLATAMLAPARAGSLLREVYQGIGGNSVAELTNAPIYPKSPTFTNFVTDFFESPSDFDESYGQRMHGYVIPPVTGNYTFWIATDDNGVLYLSTDETPAKTRQIAVVSEWTGAREWTKFPGQKSAPIALEAGKAYYILALQKEGGGGDNLAVRWLRPDGKDEGPIPATYLLPWGTSFTAPEITGQPTNTTVVEGGIATFAVTVKNPDVFAAEWRRDGTVVAGQTGLVLSYGPAAITDDGATFAATVTNKLGSVVSAAATLRVLPDTTPPRLLGGVFLGPTSVRISFSEPVSAATAVIAGNYSVDGGVTVTGAAPGPTPDTVVLTTTPVTFGATYTVRAAGVQDRARVPNTIQAGSSITFLALELVSQDIGATGGSIQRIAQGGYDVSGGGSDIGGTADQLQFAWEQRDGNFDLQVRVAAATMTDPFLHAGLMVRGSLATNAAFAGIFGASPQVGCFFESRATTGAAATTATLSGGFPVNYPQTWLRLRRVGNVLTGFAGLDGKSWTQLGTATVTLPTQVQVGFALCSGDAKAVASAQFRDHGATTSTTVVPFVRDREPMGPTSRRTGLVFSEVMYHPKAAAAAGELEFIEIHNADSIFEDMGGWQLKGGVQFTFPQGFRLPAGDIVVVASDPERLKSVHGITNVVGPFTGSLGNSGDTVRLTDASGAIKLDLTYGTRAPWPVAADGTGHSLALRNPSYGESDARAWGQSEVVGGSPGRLETLSAHPHRGVVINEILAHTDLPQLDYVELHNRTPSPVDLSGCFLTDDPATNRFRLPPGTILPARGFLAFDETQLGFRLDAAGETVLLINPDATRVIDVIRFGAQENGVASGRSPDGTDTFRRLDRPTPGAANAPWRLEDIVINELMYAPISGDTADEYVELFNRGTATVDLSGWRFVDGIDLKFPTGTIVPAGGYLVVAKDPARLLGNHPQLNAANLRGDYQGSLKDSGDHVALAKPDDIVVTNAFGELSTNLIHIVVSEVAYGTGLRWGPYASGGGSSLELIDPRADPLRAASWAASDESKKSRWTTVSTTGKLDNGATDYLPNRLHISMLGGTGEALVDDVEVFKVTTDGSVTNLVRNPDFETGSGAAATSWVFNGNHSTSGADAVDPIAGTRSLHIRGQGDGDTGINSIRTALASGLTVGSTATIRAKARWIAGVPEVLFKLRGAWLDLGARLPVPKNLGTPGLPNSRAVANAGPAIYEVAHTPPLPRANEAVVVTCRVSDADGIASVNLRYRIDPAALLTTVAMRDDGTGGDAAAGDGIYSATLSGRGAGTLVAFRIQASDANATTAATTTFPAAAPAQECLVRWGETVPVGSFAHYHLWNTQAVDGQRSSALNNTYRDATLVYGDFRVVYNVGFRDKGSPFHGGGGSYALNNPDDEPLLGVTDRIFRATGNGGQEATGLRNQLCGWIGKELGIPYLHSHYMQVWRNGGQFYNLTQDEEVPTADYAKAWFPSSDEGDHYKIAVWFEFQDDNSTFAATGATLESFKTTGGAYKLPRYRFNWQTRGYQGTANNYTNIFDLVAAANDPSANNTPAGNYVPRLLNLVDMDEWMHVFAYHRVLGNWDSYSFSVGQNMYAYKLPSDRWKLMPWDIDFTLGDGNGATDGLWGGQDPVVNRMYDTPAFRRMLWRAYQDALAGPLQPDRYSEVIAARRSALVKNGIAGITAPTTVTSYLAQRRTYIQTQLKANDTAQLTITSGGGINFTSTSPTATLTGKAPFAVAAIAVNGAPFPATWTDQNSYSVVVPLTGVRNEIVLTGVDRSGIAVPGAAKSIVVTYNGAIPRAQDNVVINEIQYNPAEADASFVEIFNRSANTPFDLSGFRLDGTGYTFPDGSVIQPGKFFVLAKDRGAFALAYGAAVAVLGEFPGSLSNSGEHLKLVRPDPVAGGTNDSVIDDVRYDDHLPWPGEADGAGSSLQLIDPTSDTYRVGNWTAAPTNDVNRVTPGRANIVKEGLPAFPLVWLNEVLPDDVAGPLDNTGRKAPFIELYNSDTSVVDLSAFYLTDTYTNLTRWQFPAGTVIAPGSFLVVWADGRPEQTAVGAPHTSFRLDPGTGSVALVRIQGSGSVAAVMDYLDYRQLPTGRSFGSYPDGEPRGRRSFHAVTPGKPNDPAFPEVRVVINEFMAGNLSTLADPADQKFDDWFELFNAGTTAVDLTSYRLTDNLTNSTQFVIPPGYVIPPGGFLLVWADNDTRQNVATNRDLHVDFKLSLTGEQLGLFSPDGTLVDGLTFGPQSNDVSQGRYPDGEAGPLVSFPAPTPRGPNIVSGGNLPPVLAAIPDKTVAEQTLLSFKAGATDADAGQSIVYGLGADAPAGASIDPATGAFVWTPGEEQGPGTFTFTVRATDNGTPPRSASQRVKVIVTEADRAPLLAAVPDATAAEGSRLTLTFVATDPDVPANKLTFSLDPGAPAGAEVDPSTGLFSWTPYETQGGQVFSIVVRVTDDGTPSASATRTFNVTVDEVNNPPVVAQLGPQEVDEGQRITVQVQATDPEGGPLLYSLGGNPPEGVGIDPGTGVIRWTPTEAQGPGTYPLIVRATEKGGAALQGQMTFGITVREVDQPPVLAPIADVIVEEGSVVVLDAIATDGDIPEQPLRYSLVAPAPAGAEIDPAGGRFTWATPDDTGATTHRITVQVTDGVAGDPGAMRSFTIVTVPKFRAVINEVMYQPRVADAAYVELHNPSAVTTQDLSGMHLSATQLDYQFPAGTLLAPGRFLVVAQDRAAFAAAYGAAIPVLGTWTGRLDRAGSVLGIFSGTPGALVPMTRVDLRATLPWPAEADGTGSALQLIDARRDPARVANWAAAGTDATPRWQHVVQQGTASSSTLYIYLETVGAVHIDDLKLVAGTDPDAGANLIAGGDFESAFPGAFVVSPNMDKTATTTTVAHSGRSSLHLVATSPGSTRGSSVNQDLATPLVQGAPYTLSYWYLPETTGGTLTLRLSGSGIRSTIDVAPATVKLAPTTPGTTNSVADSLPGFPPVWINEVLPDNTTGIVDSKGAHGAWIELVNRGPTPVGLDGWSLAPGYTDAASWSFPAGTVIPPGGFLVVFADGQPGDTTPTELHAGFRLDRTHGSVALSRTQLGKPAVVDYLDYTSVATDRSAGRAPEDFPIAIRVFANPTPGAENLSGPPNRPPTLAAIADATVKEGTTLAFTAVASDPDPGQALRFSLVAAPAGASITAAGAFAWTPSEAQGPGAYAITVRVTDDGFPSLSAQQIFNVAIEEVNQPPMVATLPDLTLTEGKRGSFLVAVTDPDLPKQKFSFLLRRADGAAATGPQIDSDSGLISWTPGEDDGPGTNRYVVVVTDSGVPPATVESTPFRIIVLESNLPPVIVPVADRPASVGDKLTFPVVATDPDRPAQTLSFALDAAPAGASIDARSGVLAWTPAPGQSGIQRFVVRVSDDGSPSRDATTEFRIDVAGTGTPAFTASVDADGTVTLRWPSATGVRYRVESRDLLTAPWQTLADFTGTGTAMSTTDAPAGRRERYYRLTLP